MPAPRSPATTLGITRARAKMPAPLAPSVFATMSAARAVAPLDSALVATVTETFRTSFGGRPSAPPEEAGEPPGSGARPGAAGDLAAGDLQIVGCRIVLVPGRESVRPPGDAEGVLGVACSSHASSSHRRALRLGLLHRASSCTVVCAGRLVGIFRRATNPRRTWLDFGAATGRGAGVTLGDRDRLGSSRPISRVARRTHGCGPWDPRWIANRSSKARPGALGCRSPYHR